jgi:hypothetical protein
LFAELQYRLIHFTEIEIGGAVLKVLIDNYPAPHMLLLFPSCLKPMKNDADPAKSADEQHAVPAGPEW